MIPFFKSGRASTLARAALCVSLAHAGFATAQPAGQRLIEEVVVTAQFRELPLQDVPTAATALSGADLEARAVLDLVDVASNVPNAAFRRANAAFGNTLQAFIRGIGQNDFNYAFEPGVGTYIDDVYHATTFGALWDLHDLARVEVLRGPQGTRFGKSAIGGAVVLVSEKPQGSNEGSLELGTGSYGALRVKASWDLPLSETLAMRVGALHERADGYQDRIDFACDRPELAGTLPSEASGDGCRVGTFGGTDVLALRAALRWKPDERWTIDFTVDDLDDSSEAPANKLIAIGDPAGILNTVPGTTDGLPFLIAGLWNPNENIPNFGIPFDARFLDPDPFRTYGTYRDPIRGFDTGRDATVEMTGASLVADRALANGMSIRSITAYRRYEGTFAHDPDQSPLAAQNVRNDVGSRQFSQELRLSGQGMDGRIHYAAGLYYLSLDNTLRGLIHLPLIPGSFFGALGFLQDDRIETDSRSVYGSVDFDISEHWSASAGIRYTDEEKFYFFDHSPELIIPEPGGEPFDRVDWRISADYDLTPDAMLYGSVSTGFRSGGVNPRPFTSSQFIPFGPEEVTAWELGLKSAWLDGQVRLNVAAFLTDFDSRIQSQQTVDADGAPLTAPTNLGTGEITGIEAELSLSLGSGFDLDAHVGHASFDTDDEAFIGPRVVGVPETTAGARLARSFPVRGGTLTPSLRWEYQSRIDYANDNDPLAATGSRGLWHAQLTWDDGDLWRFSVGAENLSDKEYFVQKFTLLPFGLGTLEGQPGMPRTWHARVTRRFR